MSDYAFSSTSIRRITECDPKLQAILYEAIRKTLVDFTVVCGHRNEEDQNKAYEDGKSMLQWPESKHNRKLSRAVDVAPWVNSGIDWDDHNNFYYLAALFLSIAMKHDIRLLWGGTFEGLKDYGHFELV